MIKQQCPSTKLRKLGSTDERNSTMLIHPRDYIPCIKREGKVVGPQDRSHDLALFGVCICRERMNDKVWGGVLVTNLIRYGSCVWRGMNRYMDICLVKWCFEGTFLVSGWLGIVTWEFDW